MPNRKSSKPRVLNREQAAGYVGLSVSAFMAGVKINMWPAPIHLSQHRIGWDRKVLDIYIDRLSGLAVSDPLEDDYNEWDEVFNDTR